MALVIEFHKYFRETLNAHVRNDLGQDPDVMWEKMYDTIRRTYLTKEKDIAKMNKKYRDRRAFFEMVRFDFVLDSKLNVYLMEVNMSPNLSSKHFARQLIGSERWG